MRIFPRHRRTPYLYQSPIVEWAAQRDTFALFLEMRLGKTPVTLWSLARRGFLDGRHRTLVVAPLSVLGSWRDECWANGVRSTTLYGTPTRVRRRLAERADVFVTNYESILHRPAIGAAEWDAVVLDESPMIRNPATKRTKSIHTALGDCPVRGILTGHPAPNSDLDYVEQFRWLHGGWWMGCKSYWEWKARHTIPAGPYDVTVRQESRRLIQQHILTHAYSLTRKQAGVGPVKHYEVRRIELPKRLRTEYNAAENDWELAGVETKWTVAIHTHIRRLCGGVATGFESTHKADELVGLVRGELSGEPLVVWFAYVDEIHLVSNRLTAAKIPHRCVWGDIPPAKRDQHRREFQDGRFDVMLCQMDCARFGLNLSRADTAVIYSRSWNPESNVQMEDRIVTATKSGPVLILDLVCENTIDDDARAVAMDKRTAARAFLSTLLVRVRTRKGIHHASLVT